MASSDSNKVLTQDQTEEIAALARMAFGREPVRVAFPGGTRRPVLVADMGGAFFVFAQRADEEIARIEGLVLESLGETGAVPRLQAVHGRWVIQEYVDGDRVPVVLDSLPDDAARERLMDETLRSLVNIHDMAAERGIARQLPKAGVAKGWLMERASFAFDIADLVGLERPKLNRTHIARGMDVPRNEFIKWDARPGNALLVDQRVVWFDWEDASRSKALDDLAFVLCDEWVHLSPEAEARLLETYFPFFNRSLTEERGRYYFHLFAVTHCLLRLFSALNSAKKEGGWIDRQYLLERDKVGASQAEVANLINKTIRMTGNLDAWAPLVEWMPKLARKCRVKIDQI